MGQASVLSGIKRVCQYWDHEITPPRQFNPIRVWASYFPGFVFNHVCDGHLYSSISHHSKEMPINVSLEISHFCRMFWGSELMNQTGPKLRGHEPNINYSQNWPEWGASWSVSFSRWSDGVAGAVRSDLHGRGTGEREARWLLSNHLNSRKTPTKGVSDNFM